MMSFVSKEFAQLFPWLSQIRLNGLIMWKIRLSHLLSLRRANCVKMINRINLGLLSERISLMMISWYIVAIIMIITDSISEVCKLRKWNRRKINLKKIMRTTIINFSRKYNSAFLQTKGEIGKTLKTSSTWTKERWNKRPTQSVQKTANLTQICVPPSVTLVMTMIKKSLSKSEIDLHQMKTSVSPR